METENRMSRAAKKIHRKSPLKTYAALIDLFPLRPLHDEVDYDNALEVAEMLVGLSDLTPDQADYIDVLADIIQKYESQHHPVIGRATPLSSLKNMLEERDMTASDLGRLLGNRALGSAILRGERELSKSHIRMLADYFKVSTDLFIA